jgi:hypothetical protein
MPGARAECPNSSFICGCEEVDVELGRRVDVGAAFLLAVPLAPAGPRACGRCYE